jgi:hypothetical protein
MIREHSCHGALPDRSVDWPELVGLAVWWQRLPDPHYDQYFQGLARHFRATHATH